MNSAETQTAILDELSIQRKIKRMALEIAEQNAGESAMVLAGITGNGQTVAKCVGAELQKLGAFQIQYVSVELDKRNPNDVSLQPAVDLNNKVIILTDDVANTGRTMFFALKPFLNTSPKRLQTLALVERSHKLFPVHTDYTGLSIATTLQEHIAVQAENGRITGAWLY